MVRWLSREATTARCGPGRAAPAERRRTIAMSRLRWALLAALLVPAARADNLDKALLEHRKALVQKCVKAGWKIVGVAKFTVKLPGDKLGSRDPLSCNLADRVENALILGDEEGELDGVVRGLGQQ